MWFPSLPSARTLSRHCLTLLSLHWTINKARPYTFIGQPNLSAGKFFLSCLQLVISLQTCKCNVLICTLIDGGQCSNVAFDAEIIIIMNIKQKHRTRKCYLNQIAMDLHTISPSNYAVPQSAAGKSKSSTANFLSLVSNNRVSSKITNCIPTANFSALQFSSDALEVVPFAIQILASSRLQAEPDIPSSL